MKIYEVKIKVSKVPANGITYKSKTITGLVIAKNPTQSAETAKNTVEKSFKGGGYKFKITRNRIIRHDYIIDATK